MGDPECSPWFCESQLHIMGNGLAVFYSRLWTNWILLIGYVNGYLFVLLELALTLLHKIGHITCNNASNNSSMSFDQKDIQKRSIIVLQILMSIFPMWMRRDE